MRRFNPKAGDFFPVFANFVKYSGRFKSVTVEGLPNGLTIGRKNVFDDSTSRYHYGVVVCSSDDSACISKYYWLIGNTYSVAPTNLNCRLIFIGQHPRNGLCDSVCPRRLPILNK